MAQSSRLKKAEGAALAGETDLLDRLILDWQRERPDLDPSSMAVVGRLIRLGGLLRTSAGRALKPVDLHYTDLDVLATLRRSGEPYRLTPTQLSRSVLLTSGAMTASLNRLEKRGLIERAPDPSDGRVKAVVLSKPGRELIDRAIPLRFDEAKAAVQGLSAKEQKTLAKLLRVVEETVAGSLQDETN